MNFVVPHLLSKFLQLLEGHDLYHVFFNMTCIYAPHSLPYVVLHPLPCAMPHGHPKPYALPRPSLDVVPCPLPCNVVLPSVDPFPLTCSGLERW